jgi:hypothetical protein
MESSIQNDSMQLLNLLCLLKIGKNYSIALTVYNLGSNSTCDDISLHNSSGNVISSHDASQFKSDLSTICSVTIGIADAVSINYFILQLCDFESS